MSLPKIRAWDKESKFMTYGNLEYFDDSIGYRFRHFTLDSTYEVEFMQSAGLKDKNGVEIFEGDIVKVIDSEQINQIDQNGAYVDAFFEELNEIDEVIFDDGRFMLKRTELDVGICKFVESFEVISNVYENPELLKEV